MEIQGCYNGGFGVRDVDLKLVKLTLEWNVEVSFIHYTNYCMRRSHRETSLIYKFNSLSKTYCDNIGSLFEVVSPKDGIHKSSSVSLGVDSKLMCSFLEHIYLLIVVLSLAFQNSFYTLYA